MKFVLMHFIRNGKPASVAIESVPQMYTDEEMIEYVHEAKLCGKYLRLFERPDRFEVVERDWSSFPISVPYRENSIMKMNKEDMRKPLEKYFNKVSKKVAEAKQITGTFIILNARGDERSGNPNDWFVKEFSHDSYFRVCTPEVFEANYVKLTVLKRLNHGAVIDDLGTECVHFKIEFGDAVERCAVCGELVQEGWICQHDVYHDRCVAWKPKV